MNNLPKEVIKLKKSLANQAKKLIEEKEADIIEKKFFYAREECINPYIALYYFSRNL